jgi:hypothetical protein
MLACISSGARYPGRMPGVLAQSALRRIRFHGFLLMLMLPSHFSADRRGLASTVPGLRIAIIALPQFRAAHFAKDKA